jgi:hypothetical protein
MAEIMLANPQDAKITGTGRKHRNVNKLMAYLIMPNSKSIDSHDVETAMYFNAVHIFPLLHRKSVKYKDTGNH